MQNRGNTSSFSSILGTFGVIMIAVGIAWLIIQNWHAMPSIIKILILVGLTGGAIWGSVILKEREYPKTAKALLVLGALLYTLSVFLIAQIYSTETSIQGFAWLLFLCWIGVSVLAYLMVSPIVFWIGLIEFCVWLLVQFFALTENSSPAYAVILFLLAAIFLYGVALHHRVIKHPFARPLRFFTAFYVLLFAYILSFQSLLPMLWSGSGLTDSGFTFLIIFGVIAVAAFIISIIRSWTSLDKREFIGVIAILVLMLATLLSSYAIRDTTGSCQQKSCYDANNQQSCEALDSRLGCTWSGTYCSQTVYNYVDIGCSASNNQHDNCVAQSNCRWYAGMGYWNSGSSVPFSVWIVWIFANLVLLAAILTVIYTGLTTQTPGLVNLGMVWFGLMILTRYIGFMIDYWGQTGLAVFFIISGVVLLGGGFLLEKWRRALVQQTQETSPTSKPAQGKKK